MIFGFSVYRFTDCEVVGLRFINDEMPEVVHLVSLSKDLQLRNDLS